MKSPLLLVALLVLTGAQALAIVLLVHKLYEDRDSAQRDLTSATKDFESLALENAKLKAEVHKLQSELDHFK